MLTKEAIAALRHKGYTDAQIQQAYARVATDNARAPAAGGYSDLRIEQAMRQQAINRQAMAATGPAMSSVYAGQGDPDNLVKWQLEVDSILERIEHLLKRDKITFKDGQPSWEAAGEKDRVLNDKGVSEVLRTLSIYVNRNTILSNYDEPTIMRKVLQLGNEMNDLMYMNYEEFGMDTYEKRKYFPMMVRQIVDPVHSAYLRALNGGERETLREGRFITQAENISNTPPGYSPPMQQSGRQLFKPWTWIRSF